MDLFDSIAENVKSNLIDSGEFDDCTVECAYRGGMRPNPLKRPHIMIGLGATELSPCSLNGNSAYGSVKSCLKAAVKINVDIAVPFEQGGVTCAMMFSRLCRCVFGDCELLLEPLGISCGEISGDRYSGALILKTVIRFNALVEL